MHSAKLLMLGFAVLWPAASLGEVLTFGFEGVVDWAGGDLLAPVSIQPGEHFFYEYTFETDPPYVVGGSYYAAIGASITIGDDYFPVTPDPTYPPVLLRAQTTNPGLFGVRAHVGFDVPGLSRGGIVWADLTGVLRPDNTPPPWWPLLSPPNLLRDFSDAKFSLNIFPEEYGGDKYLVNGTIIRSYVVPEPATIVFLGWATFTAWRKR